MHAIDEMVCRKICRENAHEIVATPRARPDAEKRVPAPSALVEDFARLVRRRVARRLALALSLPPSGLSTSTSRLRITTIDSVASTLSRAP